MDFLFAVRRRQEEWGLTLPKSTKSHYSWHNATRLIDETWSDGAYLGDTPEAFNGFMLHVFTKIDSALNALSLKRDTPIREFHAM
jgi:hypothetical protein